MFLRPRKPNKATKCIEGLKSQKRGTQKFCEKNLGTPIVFHFVTYCKRGKKSPKANQDLSTTIHYFAKRISIQTGENKKVEYFWEKHQNCCTEKRKERNPYKKKKDWPQKFCQKIQKRMGPCILFFFVVFTASESFLTFLSFFCFQIFFTCQQNKFKISWCKFCFANQEEILKITGGKRNRSLHVSSKVSKKTISDTTIFLCQNYNVKNGSFVCQYWTKTRLKLSIVFKL